MSYTALYRKFRPSTFDEVKGQDHIIQTLKNQITSDRVGHAYLFCGTRGTGKTSVAKIFAKAVNCGHPMEGNPCNLCDTCKGISDGSLMNVVEIDAASNNGVDNIRQIREEIQYSPTSGRYTVYIIDEAHMLSIGAFNALLKTLEEPPAYVIFILATTEPQKIPVTILSRCQRYDFKRISIDTIAGHLRSLVDSEGIKADDKALNYLAKAADGSMRDALSLLDQCASFYLGEELTYDRVLDVLGAVDGDIYSRMVRALIKQDVTQALLILDDVLIGGKEMGQFVNDFVWYLRNLMLIETADSSMDMVDVSSEQALVMKEDAKMTDLNTIMRYIRVLSDLSGQIRYSSQKRVQTEIALIKMCRPQTESDFESLESRVSSLEDKIKDGVTTGRQSFGWEQKSQISEDSKTHKKESEKVREKVLKKAVPEDIQYVADNWNIIQKELPGFAKAYFSGAEYKVKDESTLLIVSDNTVLDDKKRKNDLEEMVNRIIAEKIKKDVNVEIKVSNNSKDFEGEFQAIQSKVGMPIEEE